jgi:Restriction Enzyme Adenine Methylase Associated
MRRGRSEVSLMDLIKAGLIQPGQVLQFTRRKSTQAHVTPRGTVLFRGVEYSSLSAAGKAVNNSAINGWVAWRVKIGNNDWVKISDLRDKVKSSIETAD